MVIVTLLYTISELIKLTKNKKSFCLFCIKKYVIYTYFETNL